MIDFIQIKKLLKSISDKRYWQLSRRLIQTTQESTHAETRKRLLLTVLHRWSTRDQGSEPWQARTSLRAVHDMRWCYTGNLYHTPCT